VDRARARGRLLDGRRGLRRLPCLRPRRGRAAHAAHPAHRLEPGRLAGCTVTELTMKTRVAPLAIAATFTLLALVPGDGSPAGAAAVPLTVRVDRPGPRINTGMWGIFFEDITLGADGGLYAELVKNRSFEFPQAMTGWFKISPAMAV